MNAPAPAANLDSLRILEIGETEFLKRICPAQVTFYYIGKKSRTPKPFLTYRIFQRLRRELLAGRYDVVCLSLFSVPGGPWRGDRALLSNLIRVARCCLRRFYAFGIRIVPWLLEGIDVPFIVVDRKDDPDVITRELFPILERCQTYFWREQPVKLENGFLFTTGYLEDTSAVRKSPVFRRNRHKIQPLSLGVPHDPVYDRIDLNEPKTIDIFFAGTIKGSSVREQGGKLLHELRGEGFNIEVSDQVAYSREEFLRKCAQSWLVWSPEGHGWDCYRHYEAGLAGSVPVMNYPRTWRYEPLIEGVHGFYYGVEGDDLKRVIRQALSDRARLREMAGAARRHVMDFHTEEKLFAHVLSAISVSGGKEAS
jgi:hypothetical protein